VKGAWGLGTEVPRLIRHGTPARLAVQGGDSDGAAAFAATFSGALLGG
jgi:hypothetical protein